MEAQKIKIVHIIGKLDVGGAERLILDLGRKLDKSRFDIQIVALKGSGALEREFAKAEVPVTVIEKRYLGDWSVIDRVADFLKREMPDIVHTHLFIGDFWGGRAAKRAGIKHLVSTKHDVMHEGFIRRFFSKRYHRSVDRVVAISEATHNFLVKKEKVDPARVPVIYNGIDIAKFFVPNEKIFDSEEIVFGLVGRLSREKGQRYLLPALKLVKNTNWKLLIVGDGPERPVLEKQVKRLKFEDKVRFVGRQTDVRPALSEMDVFVLPSLSEGLSLAVIEAAAAGKFVIASAVGGVPEIVRDHETGLLFKRADIENLVASLNWVFDHREEAIPMAARLQASVAEKFDINNIIKQYEALYESLVA